MSKLIRRFQELSPRVFNKLKREFLEPLILLKLLKLPFLEKQNFSRPVSEFSCADLYQISPVLVKKLLYSLNLNHSGLAEVRQAVMQQDWVVACEALVVYYQSELVKNRALNWENYCTTVASLSSEQILNDTFTFQGKTQRVPRLADGNLDWAWQGALPDREWSYFLNRHYHLVTLLLKYQQTSSYRYLICINEHLLDWIFSSSIKANQWWSNWRGREVALRSVHWTYLFYGLRQELAPGIRVLMLHSLLEHARFLRYLHSWGGNWLCREMRGLATIALFWPEFKDSADWFAYSSKKLYREIESQVYPDGVHKELTSHYHRVALLDFQHFADIIKMSGRTLPENYVQRLELMWAYLAYSISPSGHGLLNNDSDQDFNRPIITKLATRYHRPDWIFIATNGKAGMLPNRAPSILFPWAGQFICRNGWDLDAHWSFFDIGSFGVHYHSHYSRLHISIAAYGRDLLVDSGRYCYRRDHFWEYFRKSASHNVILVDGKGQKASPRQSGYAITQNYAITPEYDFAQGIFESGFMGVSGKVTHSRALLYLQGQYWVVIDYVKTDRPRSIETLWHFHPDCTVNIHENDTVTTNSDVGNLRIVAVSPDLWKVQLQSGQLDPMQGWWSREYNHLVPNSTAIYSQQISHSAIFAWILYPARGQVPKIKSKLLDKKANSLHFSVTVPGGNSKDILCCVENLTISCSFQDLSEKTF